MKALEKELTKVTEELKSVSEELKVAKDTELSVRKGKTEAVENGKRLLRKAEKEKSEETKIFSALNALSNNKSALKSRSKGLL